MGHPEWKQSLDEENAYNSPLEIKKIPDTQVAKRTRRKEYLRYLVKWKNRPIEESSWLDAAQIQQAGYSVEALMEQSHDFYLPQEPDAGASIWRVIVVGGHLVSERIEEKIQEKHLSLFLILISYWSSI